MKIERCKKESFIVIGKEGATTDGAGFIQKLWDEANSHFEKFRIWHRKMKMGTLAEYGVQCLIFPVPFSLGKTLIEDFTLREWSAMMTQKPLMVGQSG